MTNRTSTSFSITRTQSVAGSCDEDGVFEEWEEDFLIEGTVSGLYFPTEPDVGLYHDGFEDITFEVKTERGFTKEYKLTQRELNRAEEQLREKFMET